MRNIGILGGTFNPIHHGHVQMGLAVMEAFKLDLIFYLLSAHPPHKRARHIPPPSLRYRMLERALRLYGPGLVPSDIELHRLEPSYTITTLETLKSAHPDARFLFITGSEGFLKIRTWKDYRHVLQSVPFIVVLRKPDHRKAILSLLHEEDIPFRDGPSSPSPPPLVYLFQLQSPYINLSSTRIRRVARQGGNFSLWVDPEVNKIMEVNVLYETQ